MKQELHRYLFDFQKWVFGNFRFLILAVSVALRFLVFSFVNQLLAFGRPLLFVLLGIIFLSLLALLFRRFYNLLLAHLFISFEL